MTYDICKHHDSNRWLLLSDGKVIGSYTRKSSATRRMNALLATSAEMSNAALAVADKCASGALAADASAVQTPPASNTGGLQKVQTRADTGAVSETKQHIVMVNGKPKAIMLRTGVSTSAHIDTLTLVIPSKSVFFADGQDVDDDNLMLTNAEMVIESIMGYGFSKLGNGLHGYTNSAIMGIKDDDQVKYGFLAWGGSNQRDTVCLHFYGSGLTAAADGWEYRLYQYIKQYAPYSKITRCDLAHDFLNGEYTPSQAFLDWERGLFTSSYTRPDIETVGRGWLCGHNKGKTLYVGSRKSGSKLCRIYDKGIEQGDETSSWVRFELQLRNRDIVIDHEILIAAGEYLNGAYPICEQLFAEYELNATKTQRIEKQKQISVEHVLKHASIQVSPAIKMLKQLMGFNADEIIQILERHAAKPSKRLNPNLFDANNHYVKYLKEHSKMPARDIDLANFVAELRFSNRTVVKVDAELSKQIIELGQYLRAVFGREDYNFDIHGCDYETYISRRYGSLINTGVGNYESNVTQGQVQ